MKIPALVASLTAEGVRARAQVQQGSDPRREPTTYYAQHVAAARAELSKFIGMPEESRDQVLDVLGRESAEKLHSADPHEIAVGIAQLETLAAWTALHREHL